MSSITFANFSYDEQVERLTRFVHGVLPHYDLGAGDVRVRCVSHWQNSTFHIDASSGSYALRVNRSATQSAAAIRSELAFLTSIVESTALAVPAPVVNRAGERLTTVDAQSGDEALIAATTVDSGRHCVLFRWLEGDFLDGAALTPRHVEAVGEFTARLHNHAQGFVPPDGFVRKQLEWDGQMEQYFSDKGLEKSPLLTTRWPLLHRVRARTEPAMGHLGRAPEVYGLIHNDIYQRNLLFAPASEHGGDVGVEHVRAIDFDNCGWGHYLLDLAVTLVQLRQHSDYVAKRAALLRGYRRQRALSGREERLLHEFMLARLLLLTLYMASQTENDAMRAYAPSYVADAVVGLERWL